MAATKSQKILRLLIWDGKEKNTEKKKNIIFKRERTVTVCAKVTRILLSLTTGHPENRLFIA
ncbi:Hypothetical predicted protein [Podarcis lilfordi]|uniref:Uncharacterized protein n=1 Tax=Podarcis lilfordi TaxID=74358 RepID=A0AA35JWK8_9SAUR|nr:Hypothetical predicted protein [Podarcis lilfordi]